MSGNAAIAMVTAGLLLVFLECNRPGLVLPGACGLFLLLLGVHQIVMGTTTLAVVFLLLGGVSTLVFQFWYPAHGVAGAIGTGCLLSGFLLLRHDQPAISSWSAFFCALLLGVAGSLLLLIAGQARRLKRTRLRGAARKREEWWGVD